MRELGGSGTSDDLYRSRMAQPRRSCMRRKEVKSRCVAVSGVHRRDQRSVQFSLSPCAALRLSHLRVCDLGDELQSDPMNFVMLPAMAHACPALRVLLLRAQRNKRVRLKRLGRVDRDPARRHVHTRAGLRDRDDTPVCRQDGARDGDAFEPSAIAKESVERLRVACEGARVVVHGCYLFARLHISPRRAPSFPGARVLSRTL